jgi:hypothetical protein
VGLLKTNIIDQFIDVIIALLSIDRWILRMKKPSNLKKSTSQSSFQSCTDDNDNDKYNEFDTNNQSIEDEYVWRTPSVLVHNILFGRLWCEFQGTVDIRHTQSKYASILTIKPHSWFTSQSARIADMFKFTGFIYNNGM